MSLRTPETATPKAIRRLAEMNLALAKKNRELKEQLKQAVQYLREGKAKFTPNTTNSFVDEFLKRHEK